MPLGNLDIKYPGILWSNDQPSNNSFSDKIESIQFNAALAITGTIRGTSKEKLCTEIGLEHLRFRRWLKIALFIS